MAVLSNVWLNLHGNKGIPPGSAQDKSVLRITFILFTHGKTWEQDSFSWNTQGKGMNPRPLHKIRNTEMSSVKGNKENICPPTKGAQNSTWYILQDSLEKKCPLGIHNPNLPSCGLEVHVYTIGIVSETPREERNIRWP